MNNTTQQNEKKRNVVSSLHLLKEHLSQSKLRSLSINSESLSKLKSFKKRFSHSNTAINSSSSQDDKNKRIKDLEFTANPEIVDQQELSTNAKLLRKFLDAMNYEQVVNSFT